MATYDVAVLGAGPGGYHAAIRAAQLGLKTALIEKDPTLGGTCVNVGCIPSKALLESSELYAQASHAFASHGIATGKVEMDVAALLRRKTAIVKELTDGLDLLMRKNKITVVRGFGKFTGPRTIAVDNAGKKTEVEASNVVLAMGSTTIELPFLKFDGKQIVSSTEALCFDKVPKHLVVVGAGAIGLEMGSVWSRLGAQVTVIELLDRIAPTADKQASQLLQRVLTDQGLTFKLKSKVTGAAIAKGKLSVTVEGADGKTETIACDKLLVAVGRRGVVDGANLEAAGVRYDKRGKIAVDHHLRTNVPHIYAIGDIIAGPMLAHKAEDEGVAAAEIIAGKPGHVNYETIPNIIYTWPELAEVGLSEDEAKEKGIAVRTGKYFFKPNGRAKTLGDTDGFVKFVADAKTDRVLGVHIVGPRASDLIAEAVVAMEFRASSEDVGRIVHAHPTLSEVMKEAALAVDRRAIHG